MNTIRKIRFKYLQLDRQQRYSHGESITSALLAFGGLILGVTLIFTACWFFQA